MIVKIELIKNSLLKQHERIKKYHLNNLLRQIKNDGYLNDPIIVDKNTMTILDGHHRFNVFKLLGLSSSPVFFVDYKNRKIKVSAWRDNEKIIKKDVINAGLSGKLLRPKTSRHFIPNRPTGLKISLKKLT